MNDEVERFGIAAESDCARRMWALEMAFSRYPGMSPPINEVLNEATEMVRFVEKS